MFANKITSSTYRFIIKPIMFKQDPEVVHDRCTALGNKLSSNSMTNKLLSTAFSYKNSKLKQNLHGISFSNPIGLAAGFDYNGYLAETMNPIGFGFNTVGTVTAQKYEGNAQPRLARLPNSKALLVNKGFKSEGVNSVEKRLDTMKLADKTVGISIGSSNVSNINTVKKAIDDYIVTFDTFKDKDYVKYFELNISCPNAEMNESFTIKKNFTQLLFELKKVNVNKPIFVKMASELTLNQADRLVHVGVDNKMSGFVFSNLVKDRSNTFFSKGELKQCENLKGNFAGKPAEKNANHLIKHIYREYGDHTTIIGCGGVFDANDAYKKIRLGSSLVQLITGMIYEGPQVIGEINHGLTKLLDRDGFEHISQAIGVDA